MVNDMTADMLGRSLDGNGLTGGCFWFVVRLVVIVFEQFECRRLLSLDPLYLAGREGRLRIESLVKAFAASEADDLQHDQEGEYEPGIPAMANAGHFCLPQRQDM